MISLLARTLKELARGPAANDGDSRRLHAIPISNAAEPTRWRHRTPRIEWVNDDLGAARETPRRTTMDYIKPADVASAMVETGSRKLTLNPSDLMIRGALAGGILGVATSLAFTGTVSTGQPIVGALIFPVGL